MYSRASRLPTDLAVDRGGGLEGGLLPGLSGLPLQQLGDPLVVVEQPVAEAPEPFAAPAGSEGFPSRLVAPYPSDGGSHLLGPLLGQ
jgi:hypothetical protein